MRLRAAGVGMVAAVSVVACMRYEPETPLAQAAARGDATAVRRLLASGADPNGFDGHGATALIMAARAGQVAALEELIAAGADPNLRDRRSTGWTPLMHAVHKRRTAAARALLDHGAEPNAGTPGGVTALMMAAAYGDTPTVRLLLDRGADPRLRAKQGVTALANAAGRGGLFDITDGSGVGVCHPDTVRLLLAKAPDLEMPPGPATRVSLFVTSLAGGRGCDETRALIAAHRPPPPRPAAGAAASGARASAATRPARCHRGSQVPCVKPRAQAAAPRATRARAGRNAITSPARRRGPAVARTGAASVQRAGTGSSHTRTANTT